MTARTWNLPLEHPTRLAANDRQLLELLALEALARAFGRKLTP